MKKLLALLILVVMSGNAHAQCDALTFGGAGPTQYLRSDTYDLHEGTNLTVTGVLRATNRLEVGTGKTYINSAGQIRSDTVDLLLGAQASFVNRLSIDANLAGATTESFVFYVNGVPEVNIEQSGEVGINTADPVETLHVKGGIRMEKYSDVLDYGFNQQFSCAQHATQTVFTVGLSDDTMTFFQWSATAQAVSNNIAAFYVQAAAFDTKSGASRQVGAITDMAVQEENATWSTYLTLSGTNVSFEVSGSHTNATYWGLELKMWSDNQQPAYL